MFPADRSWLVSTLWDDDALSGAPLLHGRPNVPLAVRCTVPGLRGKPDAEAPAFARVRAPESRSAARLLRTTHDHLAPARCGFRNARRSGRDSSRNVDFSDSFLARVLWASVETIAITGRRSGGFRAGGLPPCMEAPCHTFRSTRAIWVRRQRASGCETRRAAARSLMCPAPVCRRSGQEVSAGLVRRPARGSSGLARGRR